MRLLRQIIIALAGSVLIVACSDDARSEHRSYTPNNGGYQPSFGGSSDQNYHDKMLCREARSEANSLLNSANFAASNGNFVMADNYRSQAQRVIATSPCSRVGN